MAERVLVVTSGIHLLEGTTRAKTVLILILAEPEKETDKKWYQKTQVMIKAAEDEGLVDLQVIERLKKEMNANQVARIAAR